jgi:hypothetical protein
MRNSSPLYPPAVPRHGSPQVANATKDSSSTIVPRPVASVDGLRRGSALAERAQVEEEEDEDTKFLRENAAMIRRITDDPPRARDSWLVPSVSSSPGSSYTEKPLKTTGWRRDTAETTTRKAVSKIDNNPDNNMFAPSGTASNVAQRKQVKSNTPQQNSGSTTKVMTPAQFERYRQEQDRHNISTTLLKGEDNDEDAYEEDDEDEEEKQKQIAKQRRKQEAHMAVYRQQMMKVTGETPSPSSFGPRPGMVASQSAPNLQHVGSTTPEDGDEEDEEIPLAILAAHGFPNKNKPPGRLSSMTSNPNLRASSQMSSYPAPPHPLVGESSGGRLPVFARGLPQDPYYGAGLVNASNRESLAYGSGSQSVQGGALGPKTPGGLVGVIATEERSRAMRRGSPNAAGGYGPPPPSNGFNGMGAPNAYGMNGHPSMVMGPNGPMPRPTPGDQAQMEMQQQMQQFMMMQMQFMQMMSGAGGSQGRPQSQNGPGPAMPSGRASVMGNFDQGNRPISSHQRAMSMLDPNMAPWQEQPGMQRNTMFAGAQSVYSPANQYAPSIAPSERSNVGLPGRYRPVSQYPVAGENKSSRTATMSGALQDWSDNKQGSTTVKAVKKPSAADDDDDEAGWEAMKAKKEKKQSKWRSKKQGDENGLKEMLGYTT